MEKAGFSRRNFLMGAGAIAGAVAVAGLAGCSSDESSGSSSGSSEAAGIAGTTEAVTFDESYDVIVVGAGSSGEMAALEALDAGLSVAVLEALSTQQGASVFTESMMIIAGTGAEGTTATAEDVYNYYISADKYNNEALCRTLADNETEVYERLVDLGVEFVELPNPAFPEAGFVRPEGMGAEILTTLTDAADEKGQVLKFDSRARHLVYNADGRVIGVAAEEGSDMKYYEATGGVILATGSFMHNQELLKCLGPAGMENIDYASPTGPGDRGDGLLMGWELGASSTFLAQGTYPQGYIGIGATPFVDATYSMPGQAVAGGGVLLNFEGERFVSETAANVVQSVTLQSNEGKAIAVYDDPIYQEYGSNLYAAYGLEQKGDAYQFKADTFEELFAAIQEDYPEIDADICVSTMETYNNNAAAGADPDFGRIDPVSLSTAPYYAIVVHCSSNCSSGGLVVDGDSGVVHSETEEAIPGLYAAGVVSTGVNGVTGSNVLRGLVQGMVAARKIATESE